MYTLKKDGETMVLFKDEPITAQWRQIACLPLSGHRLLRFPLSHCLLGLPDASALLLHHERRHESVGELKPHHISGGPLTPSHRLKRGQGNPPHRTPVRTPQRHQSWAWRFLWASCHTQREGPTAMVYYRAFPKFRGKPLNKREFHNVERAFILHDNN